MDRWSRPYFESTGAKARVNIVAFGRRLPASGVGPAKDDGWPEDADWPDAIPIRPYDLADPEQRSLFLLCLHGSIRDRADDVLGESAAELDTAPFAFGIEGEIEEPKSLDYLQSIHAMLRLLARSAGVFAALNYESLEWINVNELASGPPTPFDVADWIGMVFETDPDPDFGHVLHTRGMRQFGRPDLMMLGFDEGALDAAGGTIVEVATKLALGAALDSGEPLSPGDNGPDVGLDNDAMILSRPPTPDR